MSGARFAIGDVVRVRSGAFAGMVGAVAGLEADGGVVVRFVVGGLSYKFPAEVVVDRLARIAAAPQLLAAALERIDELERQAALWRLVVAAAILAVIAAVAAVLP